MNERVPLYCVVPPHILRELARRGSPDDRARAREALALSDRIRERRASARAGSAGGSSPGGHEGTERPKPAAGWPGAGDADGSGDPGSARPGGRRTVRDARHGWELPGAVVRREGDPASRDRAVDEAFDGAGATRDFYREALGRDSLDGRGMALEATVHYGRAYDNAFWDGRRMVYGDGDGRYFRRFTIALDVIGHELSHGVIQHEANLDYEGQPGALNESFADVLGTLVRQRALAQTAAQADWLVGRGLFTSRVRGVALRSLRAPGTAYDDDVLGRDPQPAHMRDYADGEFDNGGVHINSGIPNHAFYRAAAAIGGFAWERAGRIWYVALRDTLRPGADFGRAAAVTARVAGELYGEGSREQEAVREAWEAVGVRPAPEMSAAAC